MGKVKVFHTEKGTREVSFSYYINPWLDDKAMEICLQHGNEFIRKAIVEELLKRDWLFGCTIGEFEIIWPTSEA